jgi:hypothetical protein
MPALSRRGRGWRLLRLARHDLDLGDAVVRDQARDLDRGPGRLGWEGARELFPGVSEAKRRETLKTLVFEFPRDPGEGQDRLEDTYEFIMAVDAMDIDDKYTSRP